MWAAEDDRWEPTFIETGVRKLHKDENCHARFPQMDNIDSFNHVIRNYPGYDKFTVTEDKRSDILRFLTEPEILGN